MARLEILVHAGSDSFVALPPECLRSLGSIGWEFDDDEPHHVATGSSLKFSLDVSGEAAVLLSPLVEGLGSWSINSAFGPVLPTVRLLVGGSLVFVGHASAPGEIVYSATDRTIEIEAVSLYRGAAELITPELLRSLLPAPSDSAYKVHVGLRQYWSASSPDKELLSYHRVEFSGFNRYYLMSLGDLSLRLAALFESVYEARSGLSLLELGVGVSGPTLPVTHSPLAFARRDYTTGEKGTAWAVEGLWFVAHCDLPGYSLFDYLADKYDTLHDWLVDLARWSWVEFMPVRRSVVQRSALSSEPGPSISAALSTDFSVSILSEQPSRVTASRESDYNVSSSHTAQVYGYSRGAGEQVVATALEYTWDNSSVRVDRIINPLPIGGYTESYTYAPHVAPSCLYAPELVYSEDLEEWSESMSRVWHSPQLSLPWSTVGYGGALGYPHGFDIARAVETESQTGWHYTIARASADLWSRVRYVVEWEGYLPWGDVMYLVSGGRRLAAVDGFPFDDEGLWWYVRAFEFNPETCRTTIKAHSVRVS
jgi:hypothetical protein